MERGLYIPRYTVELHDYKTVLSIKESKYETRSLKAYKNCRLIDL